MWSILSFFSRVFFTLANFCRCGCDECVISRLDDSLRHSRSRINAYRALASPSLIALSSKDPILTAFELSWELRRLSFLEHEFKVWYQNVILLQSPAIIIIVRTMPKCSKKYRTKIEIDRWNYKNQKRLLLYEL